LDGQDLRHAVEAQAQARIDGDLSTFASYMTPQSLLRLHRAGAGPRAASGRSYEVIDLQVNGDVGYSDVRYSGRGSYVLRTRWERRDGLWKAVVVEVPKDGIKMAFWKRVLTLAVGRDDDRLFAERRDLS
jgi:hypothetical protein